MSYSLATIQPLLLMPEEEKKQTPILKLDATPDYGKSGHKNVCYCIFVEFLVSKLYNGTECYF
jgi:hypothetical protein